MNPYDVHSWSKHYREEVLREVDTWRLEGRLQEKGEIGALDPYRGLGPWSVRRIVLATAVVVIITASAVFSAPAFASHEHYLVTPGPVSMTSPAARPRRAPARADTTSSTRTSTSARRA
jgi:hypothetical protein